jgi:hypothetical protein
MSQLKIDYKTVAKALGTSGFGYDNDKKFVIAPDNVWATYLEKNPDAARFQKQSFPQYERMHELCVNIVATGQARSNFQTRPKVQPGLRLQQRHGLQKRQRARHRTRQFRRRRSRHARRVKRPPNCKPTYTISFLNPRRGAPPMKLKRLRRYRLY